jgi:exodeoxyribonuclease VII large subunit
MVADLRASTPTAAAEAVAPSLDELQSVIGRERRALARALQNRVHSATLRVARLAERPVLRDPPAVLGAAEQALDARALRLARVLPERLARHAERLAIMRKRVGRGLPRLTASFAGHAGAVRGRLLRAGGRLLARPADEMALRAARLDALSPLAILRRGYSVTYAADGRTIVSSVAAVGVGEAVRIRVRDGHIGAEVTSTASLSEAEGREER